MNLSDFLKINTKGNSIHHLLHRGHEIKALQLLGRNTGSVRSENRAISPMETQTGHKG